MASGLIDLLCEVALLVPAVLLASVAVSSADEALAAVAFLVVTVGVLVMAPTAMETVTRGKTPGKYALGLRAVRDDAGPISFRHAFVRALVGVRRDLAVPRGPGAVLRAAQPARQAAR